MLEPGLRLGVAVSGGADSVCLLDILRELAPRFGVSLAVLHLDHKLRGEASTADAAFVRDLAAAFGLPARIEETDAALLDPNLEQAGRHARHSFYARAIGSGFVDRIATGHTRSDQAETVLYRLIRGSGTAGLAGILPVTAEGLIRPLLDCDRREVRAWLEHRGLAWREDASNADLAFDRNRIRREILPAITRDLNPSVERVLARTAAAARDEEAYWDDQVRQSAAATVRFDRDAALLPVQALLAMPPALARRLVRYLCKFVKGDLRSLGIEHIDAILGLATLETGSGRTQIPGLDAMRSFDWLRIAQPRSGDRSDRDYSEPISALPADIAVTEWDLHIRLEPFDAPPPAAERGYNTGVAWLDAERAGERLTLRNWRPGDRYEPAGRSEVRLKTLFQDAKVPLWERQGWPILSNERAIVWTRSFGPAAQCVPGPGTRKWLRISDHGRRPSTGEYA